MRFFFLCSSLIPGVLCKIVVLFLFEHSEEIASFLANKAMKKPSPCLAGSVRIRHSAERQKERVRNHSAKTMIDQELLLLSKISTYSLQTLEDHGIATRGRAWPSEIHVIRQWEEQI